MMKSPTTAVSLLLLMQAFVSLILPVVSELPELDGNTFLITNKYYHHANLAQTSEEELVTFELKVYPDQFWQLDEDPVHTGYYYIKNVLREGYRLGKFGPEDEELIVFNGLYHNDQLWKFEHVKDDYYRIYNFQYRNAKLAKYGKENDEICTFDGSFHDDQLWKLTPRFKAEVDSPVIWSCDNRQGTADFSETITITKGLTLTSSQTISTKTGLEISLKLSAEYGGVASAEMETKITQEIERSLSHSREENWSRTTEVTFTAPKGKNYRVKQLVVNFDSPLADDDCALKCNYIVEESDHNFRN